MSAKIKKKIVDFRVITRDDKSENEADLPLEPQPEEMHEKLERPEMLVGSTYKVKTPLSAHTLYVTINDIVLNPGTDHETRQPYEIFINSKNMDHFQWVVALTRVISAVFRKGGDITFLVEELSAVFDPKGGYFKRGGKFMPSLVAEIGDCLERHLKLIGLIEDNGLDDHQKALIAQKRAEYEAKMGSDKSKDGDSAFPENASLCMKCSMKAAIMMDGCLTCLNCGESKCG